MANPLFAFPDRTLGATLTGGAWEASLPLANLKDPALSKVARSTSALVTATKWDMDLGAERVIRVMALCRHNASAAATARWQFYADAGYTQLVHDTDWKPFWPDYWPVGAQEWEEPEYWTGTLSAEDIAAYDPKPDLWHVLTQPIYCRYVRVEIDDTANPAGYFECGRAFVAPALQAVEGVMIDPTAGWQSQTQVEQALGGVEFFGRRRAARVIAGTCDHLTTAEGMVMVFDRQRRLDIHGELYFIWDPDDTLLLYRQRSMLCRFTELDPLTFPYFDGTQNPFSLKEVL